MENREGERPYVLGIGGTVRPDSSSQRALSAALRAAAEFGAETRMLSIAELDLPMYSPESEERTEAARLLVAEVGRADGLIVSSPGYHGGISGPVKNALDYLEDLRDAPRPYLEGIPVGCIACAHGWQATVTTLTAMRAIVHALRGWPTPLGVAVNSMETRFDEQGDASDPALVGRMETLARQVVEFPRHPAAAGAL
jgi:FMN reductase